MKKCLVVSSDDFGMTASVNEGIRLAHNKGVLSSTNLMVPCPWFEHASFLAQNMNIDIGVHLTLTSEWRFYRWRPITGRNTLSDSSGYFYSNIEEMMLNASERDIENECRAQIEEVLEREHGPSYIDLHMCIPSVSGVLPNSNFELEIMDLVAKLAREYKVPYAYEVDSGKLKYFDSGLSISSKERARVKSFISSLGEGVHHLSCHCAVDSYEQSNLAHPEDENYPWSSEYRRNDTRLILSDWFSELIDRHKITIIKNYFSSQSNMVAKRA